MKNRLFSVVVLIAFGICFQVSGQTVEKSSGVVQLNMKKKSTRANGDSQPVVIPMGQKAAVELTGEVDGFTWISPTMSSVKTSESTYQIKATVNSNENIRFVNLFINGQFVRNIIPPVSTIRQLVIDERMDLTLGSNELKIEAVSTTGKKLESSVEIVYDITSAKYYALIIAVERYNDPAITDLDQPIRDANRFYNVISSDYIFEKENIIFLKNPAKADIIGTLHKMRNQVTPKDNLLIYYAGHGYWDEEMTTGYWLPRDASRDNPVNWLPNTDLTNYLNVLNTKHTLLIADACFSGGIFKSRAAFNNVMSIEKLYKLTSRKAMTSGTLKEVPDKSVFIEYLIKRLSENNKKYMPSEQLYSSLREAVMNNSPNIPQYGTIQNVGDEGGDFVFIRRD
ncbi:MAG: caspase family protein [Bacteroidales bacterium]|nr:caspase family protein [Bacteroidales bacterium]